MFTVVVLGLIALVLWAGSLYLWPFAPCRKCGGSGRNRGSDGKRHGECRRCKTSGRRIRIGARTVHRGRVSLAERAREKRKTGK